jgi:hypothetical protein
VFFFDESPDFGVIGGSSAGPLIVCIAVVLASNFPDN